MHLLDMLIVEYQLLKMLGLYLYTLIIGHKSCNMLSKLKINITKGLARLCYKNVFLDKK